MRVHELAKELGLTNKEAVDLCLVMGIDVKSHSSSIIEAQADRVRRRAERDGLVRDEQPEEPKPEKKAAAKKAPAKKAAVKAADAGGDADKPVKKAAAKKAVAKKAVAKKATPDSSVEVTVVTRTWLTTSSTPCWRTTSRPNPQGAWRLRRAPPPFLPSPHGPDHQAVGTHRSHW